VQVEDGQRVAGLKGDEGEAVMGDSATSAAPRPAGLDSMPTTAPAAPPSARATSITTAPLSSATSR